MQPPKLQDYQGASKRKNHGKFVTFCLMKDFTGTIQNAHFQPTSRF